MKDIKLISKQGWYAPKIESLNFDLGKLSDEFEDLYLRNLHKDRYVNVAELNLQEIYNTSEIRKAYLIVSNAYSELDSSLVFSKLWLVKSEQKNADPTQLPYVPHIDKLRFAKAMLYLDDVEIGDGPLTIAKQPPENYENHRMRMSDQHKERRENWITDLPEDAFVPCIGKSGTLIFFDTNCPHFAGLVESGHERRVLRFDFQRPGWNLRRSLASTLKVYLSNFLHVFSFFRQSNER